MNAPTLRVDTQDPTPPYEQLRRQLADLIHTGVLQPGDRLPPLRQLAGDLGLAVGTVARSYRELETAGLVRSRRGGGTRVADQVPAPRADERRQALDRHATAYLRQARLLGVDREAALDAVRRAWSADE
ncbi:GntR family transcriptional regulator [Micromonospora sp. NPDC006766]|uniref:GntR family transcriptional regulator n=1 Tax=Micromonospora sp. NPDC006766 TaxID=3154778 RepID=UPI0033CE9ED7